MGKNMPDEPASLPLREFIGDRENRLIQFVALSLQDDDSEPSQSYNPLVLVGPTGVGKSMIARGLARRYPAKRTIIHTGADFARAFRTAVETNSVADLRQRHAGALMFVVDDVQQLQGRAAAQQELAYVIDLAVEEQRQVVVTCPALPIELSGMLPELTSRLSGGLTVPIAPPGRAARAELLRKLSSAANIEIHEDQLDLLAARLVGPAALLRHAVVQLGHMAKMAGRPVDAEMTAQLLEDEAVEAPSPKVIARQVSKTFQVKLTDLKGPSRRQAVVRARGAAAHLMRTLTGMSFSKIGECLGGRDHATVMHACRKTADALQSDPTLRQAVEEIKEKLCGAQSAVRL